MQDTKIGMCGVALIQGKLRNVGNICLELRKNVNSFLLKKDYFLDTNFSWISVTFRFGIKTDLHVEFKRINKKYGDLPIAVELDMDILQWADQHNLDLLRDIFMIATLEALLQVCAKYKLDDTPIKAERRKYSDIPATIEECEYYQ